MDYRTHNQELLNIISKGITPSDSVKDIWSKFKIAVSSASTNFHPDIQDYGIAIEFYQDKLYINLQIENSNQGFDFIEQASIILAFDPKDKKHINEFNLDLWKENEGSNETMFKAFESRDEFKQLIELQQINVSFNSDEV